MEENGSAERQQRLINIFEREIDREIAERMVAVGEISDNIRECQRSMDRLRKEAVLKFYNDSKQTSMTMEQPSIHPAVKKLIGKRPREQSQTEDFFNANMWEWKRVTRKKLKRNHALMIPKRKPNQVIKDPNASLNNGYIKRPCYIPPKLPGNLQETSSSRGNTSKKHMRVLVGNVARAVEMDVDDAATHKWMVYVRSAFGSLSVDKEVSKVRFFLHPSYKPHDVITVPHPPFTLSRRGWGEFPMRVQLFFKNPLNKTADIIHILKLNGARSGFHTRSAETFADLWIHPGSVQEEMSEHGGDESKKILWLASDILREEVPEFTTEIRCHKCRRTSTGAAEHSCLCDGKLEQSESSSDQSDCESSRLTSEEDSMSSRAVSRSESRCSSPVHRGRVETVPTESKVESASSEKASDKNEESDLPVELDSMGNSPFFDSRTSFESDYKSDQMEFMNLKDTDIFDALEIKQEPPGDDTLNCSLSDVHETRRNKMEKDIEKVNCNSRTCSESEGKDKSEPSAIKEESIKIDDDPLMKKEAIEVNDDTLIKGAIEIDDEIVETEVVYDHDDFGSPADSFVTLNVDTNLVLNKRNPDIDSEKAECNNPQSMDDLNTHVSHNTFEVKDSDLVVEETPISVNDFLESIVDEKQFSNLKSVSGNTVQHTVNSAPVFNHCLIVDKTTIATSTDQLKQPKKNLKANSNVVTVKPSVDTSNISVQVDSNKTIDLGSKIIVSGGTFTYSNSNNLRNPRKLLPKTVPITLPIAKKLILADKNQINHRNSISSLQNGIQNRPSLITHNRKQSLLISSIQNSNSLLKPSVQKSIELQKKGQCSATESKQNEQNATLATTKYCVVIPKFEINSPLKSVSKNTVIVNRPSVTAGTAIQRPSFQPISQQCPQKQNLLIKAAPIKNNLVLVSKCQQQSTTFQIPSANLPVKNCVFTTAGIKSPVQSSTLAPNTRLKQPVHNISLMKTVQIPLNSTHMVGTSSQNKVSPIRPVTLIKTALTSCTTSSMVNSKVQTLLPRTVSNFRNYAPSTVTTTNAQCTENSQGKNLSNILVKPSPDKSVAVVPRNKKLSAVQGTKTPVQELLVNNTSRRNNHQKKIINWKSRLLDSNGTLQDNLTKDRQDASLISICELCKILRIEYPNSKQTTTRLSINDKSNNPYFDRTFSCNNVHSNLQSIDFLHTSLLLNKKSVMVSKEHIDTLLNDRMLFYLEQLRVLVNSCRFDRTVSAVRWLVRGLPLVHPDARLDPFKTVHPYCAASLDKFRSWPVAKQAAALWLRSRTVVLLLTWLQTRGVFTQPIWSTRAVYRWSQLHGYAPAFNLIGPDIPIKNADKYKDLVNRRTRPDNIISWMRINKVKKQAIPEEQVDVIGLESKGCSRVAAESPQEVDGGEAVLFGRPWVTDMQGDVRASVESFGTRLALEPLSPQPAASEPIVATVLSHLAASFAEDLLRASFANAFRRVGCSIEPCDIYKAILKTPEWDFLTQQGLQIDIDTTTRDSVKKCDSLKRV